MNRTLVLMISLAIPLLVGAVSGYFTSQSIPAWYETLNKPWFNPPNWVFGPVWTSLYLMMGYASYRIYFSKINPVRRRALYLYAIQLLLNFLWSFFFFYFKNPGLALAEIILIWICINLCIVQFAKIDKLSAYLLLPYIAWVSFASILNGYIFYLN
jgi:tryptophan-rich sensory protein